MFPMWEHAMKSRADHCSQGSERFGLRHPQAEGPLSVWFSLVSKAAWTGPADVKAMFGTSVDVVADNRVIFDIAGDKYRLIAHVAYPFKRVLIKVHRHAQGL